MSKLRLSLYIAFLVSMLVHLILFNAALNMRWIREIFSETPGRDFFTVKDVITRAPEPYLPDTEISLDDLLIFTRTDKEEFEKTKSEEDRDLLIEEREFIPFDASEQEIYDSIDKLFAEEKVEKTNTAPDAEGPGSSVAQEIIAIEEDMLHEDAGPAGWMIGASVERGDSTSDFVYLDEAATGATGGIKVGDPDGRDRDAFPDPADEARRELLLAGKGIPSIIKPPEEERIFEIESSEIEDTLIEDIAQIRKFSPLDDMLTVDLYTYHEPDDPIGFFEIIIKPRDDVKDFEIIPKDIVFIIDSSKSIIQHKLNQYIAGLDYAVANLNDDDRFTIVEFKNYLNVLSEELLPANADNKFTARNFLSKLKSTGETDVYQAFGPYIKERPSPDRPYLLLLVTDGKATAGIVKNRDIINSLTKINQNKGAIYAFAGGKGINRYLLDLLSYRNKGVSRFEKKMNRIGNVLKDFVDEIKDPVLINLEYNFASVGVEEVYPEILPDFFLGNKLVILGRYKLGGAFSMQLLGEASGVSKEYVFQKKLTGEDNGSRNVAKLWAFHKIYSLIGKMVLEGESSEIMAEIKSLSKRFDIKTPYY